MYSIFISPSCDGTNSNSIQSYLSTTKTLENGIALSSQGADWDINWKSRAFWNPLCLNPFLDVYFSLKKLAQATIVALDKNIIRGFFRFFPVKLAFPNTCL